MATTTFNGPVRSENGFQTVSKNATTGAITVTSGNKMAKKLQQVQVSKAQQRFI